MNRSAFKLFFPAVLSLPLAIMLYAHATETDPIKSTGGQQTVEQAYFAAGCFWKTQYIFSKVPGLVRTRVGYSGGTLAHPSYEQVCTDKTGHAEVALVEFDPAKTSYQKLLEVFFDNHDPTTVNRQGPDVGTQYRSAIFYTTPQQRDLAVAYKQKLEASHRFHAPIVTSILPAGPFYDAEEYHQDYYKKHGAVCY